MTTRISVMTRTCPFVFALALVACGDETVPTEPVTEPADVDTYITELPAWSAYAPPLENEEIVADQPSLIEQQGENFCTEREASLTRNPVPRKCHLW